MQCLGLILHQLVDFMYNNMSKKKETKKIKSLYLKTYILGLGFSFFFVPLFAYAATTYSQDLFGLFEYAKDLIDDLVLWLFTTGAVLAFMWYVLSNIFAIVRGGKPKDNWQKNTLMGLIALTLMFTFYAVSGLLAATFGIQIGIPQFFKAQDGLSPGSGNVERSYSVIGR